MRVPCYSQDKEIGERGGVDMADFKEHGKGARGVECGEWGVVSGMRVKFAEMLQVFTKTSIFWLVQTDTPCIYSTVYYPIRYYEALRKWLNTVYPESPVQ